MSYDPFALITEDGESISDRKAAAICPGDEEAHRDHLELNAECPWCGVHDPTSF